jgi:hypothetical protein
MKTKYKYIHFEDVTPQNKKTQVWLCRNNRSYYLLATIKWYSRWRQYCSFGEPNTIFNSSCHLDIADFLKQLNSEHKLKNRKAPAALERDK